MVVVLLAIVISIAVPNFREYIASSQIRTVAESIRNGLQVARGEAIKRNKNVIFTLNNDTSWTIGCILADVTATCPAIIQSKPSLEGSSAKIVLTVTGANTATFTSLGTLTSTAGQLSQVDITNSVITTAKSLRVTLGVGTPRVGANARVCDPTILVATDVKYCS